MIVCQNEYDLFTVAILTRIKHIVGILVNKVLLFQLLNSMIDLQERRVHTVTNSAQYEDRSPRLLRVGGSPLQDTTPLYSRLTPAKESSQLFVVAEKFNFE